MSVEIARVLAAMVKAANQQQPDLAGSMAKLEALRNNVDLNNQVATLAAQRSGSRAGGGVGGLAGAGGGLLASLRPLMKPGKLSVRGRFGLGTLAAGLGAAVGGGLGRWSGRSLGASTVPTLPEAMRSPVTLQSAPAVSAFLAKAAADAELVNRMEKSAANLFKSIAQGVGRGVAPLFRSPVKGFVPTKNPLTGAVTRASRPFSLPRTAATIGTLGYGTALGAQHLGVTGSNPTSNMDDYAKFKYHTSRYDQQSAPLTTELQSAIRDGKDDRAMEIEDQLVGGRFGGGGYNNMFTRNFAPWLVGAENADASSHLQGSASSQAAAQSTYNEAMRKHLEEPAKMQTKIDQLTSRMTQPGVPLDQRKMMQVHLDSLKRRFASPAAESDEAAKIADRMRAAGMTTASYQTGPSNPTAAQPAKPMAGGWNVAGPRRVPGYMQGEAMMPGDFRSYPQPWEAQNFNSPFQHAG